MEATVIDTYEVPAVVEQNEDALAKFREQVKAEDEMKSARSKMSDAALAKVRAIQAQEKLDGIAGERFVNALKSVAATPANVQALIERCNTSVAVQQVERRAQKLEWFVAAGFRLGHEIDSVSVINFFSELTGEEASMSDARFDSEWSASVATKTKLSRTNRGLIASGEPVQRPCKSDKKCLRYAHRRPAPAKGSGYYCSTNCAASDRARAKRAILALPSA